MKIILDTNILCRDYFFKAPHWLVLFDGIPVIPATLHIPEVVVDELLNRYKEDLKKHLVILDEANRKLNMPKNEIDVNSKFLEYKKFVSSKLEGCGIEIIKYPDTSHKVIVGRDLERKKPFKSSGAGYRDCLIWENIKEIFLSCSSQIVFITNNSKDFGKAPYLCEELMEEVYDKDRLKIFNSLSSFNDEYIKQKLEKLNVPKLYVEEAQFSSTKKWLQNNLLDMLQPCDVVLGMMLTGLPDFVDSVYAIEIGELKDIKVNNISKLENGNKLLTLSVKLELLFDINEAAAREFFDVDDELSFGAYRTRETIQLTIDLVINDKSNKVSAGEIIAIKTDYGEMDSGGR